MRQHELWGNNLGGNESWEYWEDQIWSGQGNLLKGKIGRSFEKKENLRKVEKSVAKESQPLNSGKKKSLADRKRSRGL